VVAGEHRDRVGSAYSSSGLGHRIDDHRRFLGFALAPGAPWYQLAALAFGIGGALSVISFLKERIALGVLAVFIPGLGLWAACRLAKPNSPWARRLYREEKKERAASRFPPNRAGARFRARFFDAIGGRITNANPPR
jgi:hypothetical protein